MDRVQGRDRGYIEKRMLYMAMPGKRKRHGPQRRFMDVEEEEMQRVGVKGDGARDRVRCRQMINCGNP